MVSQSLHQWRYALLTHTVKDILLKPAKVATSKPAQRTYLNTILLLTTSTLLLGVAVVAYLLFYLNYIPKIGIERAVHLQYG